MVRNLSASAGDVRDSGSVPGLGRSPGIGTRNPLHYSCLENHMDREAWQATPMGSQKAGYDCRDLVYIHTKHKKVNIGRQRAIKKLNLRGWISINKDFRKR